MKDDTAYAKTPLGQAIYNIYRKHGSHPEFFAQTEKDPKLMREIKAEWHRLKARAKEKVLRGISRTWQKATNAKNKRSRDLWNATAYFMEETFKREYGQNPRRILAQSRGRDLP